MTEIAHRQQARLTAQLNSTAKEVSEFRHYDTSGVVSGKMGTTSSPQRRTTSDCGGRFGWYLFRIHPSMGT
jgi:hypothetical protein